MKNLVRIVVWTLVALVIQQSTFWYLENVYLATDYEIKAEVVEEKEEKPQEEKEEIQIKSGIENLSVSHDGRFVAYMDNGELKIFDSKENKENDFTLEHKGQVVFYKWLTEGNSMIVIQKIKEKGDVYYEPVSYNAKKSSVTSIVDFNYNEVRIPVDNDEDKVENVEFSTATNVFYIKIKKRNEKSDLYSLNVMNQMTLVRENKNIGDIIVPTTNANCVMEMGDFVTILNSPDNIEVPANGKVRILGTDINDYVYFGDEIDGKITKIYYTTLNNETLKWNVLSLSKAVLKDDIFIDYSGKIYINDSDEKAVTELTTRKTISYEGEFVQIYSEGIIYKSGNKLIKIQLEPKKASEHNEKTS